MYDTWRAAAEAAVAIIPDIAVAVCDTGESAVLPGWLDELADHVPVPYLTPSLETVAWCAACPPCQRRKRRRASRNLFCS